MTKAKAQTLLARTMTLGKWAGALTAILVFLMQGWSIVQALRESAKKEQVRDDRLGVVEKKVDQLNDKFDTFILGNRPTVNPPHLTLGPMTP